MAQRVYGASDIAQLFGVDRACASNWIARYDNVPKPDFVHMTGKVTRRYYLESRLEEWLEWHRTTINPSTSRKAIERAAQRRLAALTTDTKDQP